MDASYKIQRGIHVHLIQFFMCPEFWVHIITVLLRVFLMLKSNHFKMRYRFRDGVSFSGKNGKTPSADFYGCCSFHGIPKMKTGSLGFRGIIRHRPKPTIIPFRDGTWTTKPRIHNALCAQTYPRPALFGRCSHGRPNSAHRARRWRGYS